MIFANSSIAELLFLGMKLFFNVGNMTVSKDLSRAKYQGQFCGVENRHGFLVLTFKKVVLRPAIFKIQKK